MFILFRFPADPQAQEILHKTGTSNPFFTAGYARAMHNSGYEVWVFGLSAADPAEDTAVALVRRGRLASTLEFASLPAAAARADFWEAATVVCRKLGITDILAHTFGSPEFKLPPLPGETSRTARTEFVLPLAGSNLPAMLAKNHRGTVRKAEAAGVTIVRSRSPEGLAGHLQAMGSSRERRSARGEQIQGGDDAPLFQALLDEGAAEIFQAVQGEQVLSSAMVLRSPQVAYYHTAGSNPEGMAVGASHFLLHRIGMILQEEGLACFNFGGAPEGTPLAKFKTWFGAHPVRLEAAECYVGPMWKKKARSAINVLRKDPKLLVRLMRGSSSRMTVFGLDMGGEWQPSISIPDARIEPLDDQRLLTLPAPTGDPEFPARQRERLQRLGRSYAWGVYIGGDLAHVSWLLPAAAVALDEPRILTLGEDEAEITACETPPAFRGKGVYGYAIQQLSAIARDQGIRRVYMKVADSNVSSLNGVRKAGFQPIGFVRLITPPLRPSKLLVRRHLAWR